MSERARAGIVAGLFTVFGLTLMSGAAPAEHLSGYDATVTTQLEMIARKLVEIDAKLSGNHVFPHQTVNIDTNSMLTGYMAEAAEHRRRKHGQEP